MNTPKIRLCTTLSIIALLAASSIRADDEAEHTALRAIKAAYEQSVNSGNPAGLAPYLSDNVTGVMVTGEPVKGLDGLKTYWQKIQEMLGPGGSYHVTVNAEKSDLFGDIAVSHGTTEDRVTTSGGKEFKFSSNWTSVCHKENGAWKVIRMQATMDPVNNPFIAARVKFTKLVFGIGGAVAGALLVLLAGLVRRKPTS